MRKYSTDYHQVDSLISRYIDAGGEAIQLDEGVLQSGDWILYDEFNTLKCFVITEEYLNEWSSTQLVKVYPCYEKLPKKYKKQIDNYLNAA